MPDNATRLRKAWQIRIKWHDATDYFFGRTREMAKREAWRSVCDVLDVRYIDISARRCPERDVVLPARDPVADLLSDEEGHCLLHAFGATHSLYQAGYRDYFWTRRDDPPLVALVERGLMAPASGDPKMTCFVLTDEGKRVALSMVPEYAE